MLRFELERSIMRRRQNDDLRDHRFFDTVNSCICAKTAAVFRKRRPHDRCSPGKCRTCDSVRSLIRQDMRRDRYSGRREARQETADAESNLALA